ncbi:thermonuclease family protein [Macrococcus sp. DPC7161]|uniref:thermonuclease family protein n=1 Tax=Macrococcus sp. DPC7161 TaxID=2507060 RepID=UPI0013E96F1D|nr:thermonuclease family protein [Macrococcus sp. DPC7161]
MKFLKLLLIASLLLILLPTQHADAISKKETVTYVSTVDGDTVKVKKGSKVITLRLLLIDTPESKDPRKPVQPYAKEAQKYLESTIKYSKLQIAYDNQDKYDKYGRHLVYLFANGKLVNDAMVKAGYARVGYIYSQVYYLDKLEASQKYAKSKKLKIWSIPGYVNPLVEGFTTKSSTASVTPTKVVAPVKSNKTKKTTKPVQKSRPGYPTSKYKSGAPKYLRNCTEVKKYYPYGITDNHVSYLKKHDRDRDRLGCEASNVQFQSWMLNN